ncbi:MAG: hypothetical protein ACI92Z_001204 [Paracoccaceae bacterium]|jgi:hypothetical protein
MQLVQHGLPIVHIGAHMPNALGTRLRRQRHMGCSKGRQRRDGWLQRGQMYKVRSNMTRLCNKTRFCPKKQKDNRQLRPVFAEMPKV